MIDQSICYVFVCCDCGRSENRPVVGVPRANPALPEGWDRFIDCGGLETVRCPDCNEAIEQRKTAELNQRLTTATLAELNADCSFSLSEAEAGKYRLHVPAPRAFAVFLERQVTGDYRVTMMPEAVLMRWLPLGFFLTADEADALAVELTDFAKLARRPGTAPDQGGAK